MSCHPPSTGTQNGGVDHGRRLRRRFVAERPRDIRAPRPWHRLAYIAQALPAALSELAHDLGLESGARVLDFGCAEGPYRGLLPPGVEYVGADLPGNPAADVLVDPDGTVPVDDASFDAVLSTQVLEHVDDPFVYLRECHRVLKPGGRLLLSTHGIMVYHPDPDDFWRWTSAGLTRVVEQAGFEIARFDGIMGLGATGLQLVQDAAYHHLPRRGAQVLALLTQSAIRIVDRLQSPESRRRDALVFAVVAQRP